MVQDVPRFIQEWSEGIAQQTNPVRIEYVIDEPDVEYARLSKILVASGVLTQLNPSLRPNSFLALSDPKDVARVEDKTFICSEKEIDAGPTNNWKSPKEMKAHLGKLFQGSMQGRVMYVIPFAMGPLGCEKTKYGVEITDSAYVAMNLTIMTRMGPKIMESFPKEFVQCIHSVGFPLQPGQKDVSWPCNADNIVIAHFPETNEVWSYGSGYGGNALLNKKCVALRLASCQARREGWLAEHMLIVGLTSPEGRKHYIVGAFPSACGKTNLAMLQPALPGWKMECVGDDIAWMFWDEHGVLRAVNPEFGFFGVAPGTSEKTNPNALLSMKKNSLFTNVALTKEKDVWWEGMGTPAPVGLMTWKKAPYIAGGEKAAHPNSRFTAPLEQCPSLDPAWNDPEGVPVSAILFGGRRGTTVPLIREASSWAQGVLFGATMTSETTAAAKGEVGKVRFDPFAMLPFCGYNMADYWSHWLSQEKPGRKMPSIYYVNWFLKGQDGTFLWPGFGDNIRVLQWILERLDGRVSAVSSPIGSLPKEGEINLTPGCDYKKLFAVEKGAWLEEVERSRAYFAQFGDRLPKELSQEIDRLTQEIQDM